MEAISSAGRKSGNPGRWVALGLIAAIDLLLLYGVTMMYASGEIAFALLVLLIVTTGTWVFVSNKGYAYRYVYPALLGVSMFIVFPLIYTLNVAFTNYSSSNLLPLDRVRAIHMAKMYRTPGESYSFKAYRQGDQYQLLFISNRDSDKHLVSSVFGETTEPLEISTKLSPDLPDGEELAFRDTIQIRHILKLLTITLPDGGTLSMTSLREFGPQSRIYNAGPHNTLIDNRNGDILTPDLTTGFYVDNKGEQIGPGFTVFCGWDNFVRVISDPGIQGPFLQIFTWTLIFSALSVLFTLVIGLLMACLVQWEPLKGNGIYRLLLILPYAVPAFISILIFRGLFNQNFGEINMLLNMMFGIQPEWFSNGFLAKTMVLIVNTWLGYPYMMILSIGLLKSIPGDLYEASAIDGASPVQNLFKITIPLIIKPLIPLLIASFAFNFNNLVLIALLTDGAPNIIGATTPAGATDLLVSYTFRIAFGQYGQDYGLASAIATFIFLMVGVIAWINLKATRRFTE